MPNSERKNEKYTVSFQYPDPGNLLGTSEAMYADRDEAVAAAARASRDPENENIQVYHHWFNTEFNRTEGEWIDWRNTEDLLSEYPKISCTEEFRTWLAEQLGPERMKFASICFSDLEGPYLKYGNTRLFIKNALGYAKSVETLKAAIDEAIHICTEDPLPEYPESSCTTKPERRTLPKRNYDKENDLAVYVQCVERLGQLASIMNVYPKTMTLEQVKETIDYQLEKYRKLVIGQ